GDTAVGADVALNIVLGWATTAAVDRDVQGSSIEITAESTTNSSARADASAKGADSSSDSNADTKKQGQVDNNPNTSGKAGTLPTASDSQTGTGKGNGEANSEGGSGSGSGGVGVAASISLNWVVTSNKASIGAGAHVCAGTLSAGVCTPGSGHVKVSASNSTDATAKATG